MAFDAVKLLVDGPGGTLIRPDEIADGTWILRNGLLKDWAWIS
jgi:hypothetical protein